MIPSREETILVKIQRELDLFPALGRGGGAERIILASYSLVSRGLRQSIASLTIDPAILRREPRANVDPVGRCLALNPFRNLDEVISRLAEENIENVLNDVRIWNPMHVNVGKDCAGLVSRLCLTHGIDGISRIEDTTLLNRVRQMTVLLHAVIDAGLYFMTAHREAVLHLSLEDPAILERIHANGLTCKIDRKKATTLERRYELYNAKLPLKDQRERIGYAAQMDDEYYLPSPVAPVDKVKAKARKYEASEESPVASPGGLGEIETSLFIDALCPPYSDGAALTGMMFVAMLASHQIHAADVKYHDGYATIETTTNSYTDLSIFDPNLHRKSDRLFGRVAPVGLSECFESARERLTQKECLLAMNKWIRSIVPRASLHRLAAALMYQGPLWYGYPSSFAHLGLASHRASMPGWRYYHHFDLGQYWDPLAKYLARFDTGTDWEKLTPPPFRCGSNCTPKDEVVQEMVATLGTLLETGLPTSVDEIVGQWNAIAALAHLLTIGHLFLRNYPWLPPEMETSGTSFCLGFDLDLLSQKKPIVIWYAPQLERLLIRVTSKWQIYAAALRQVHIELDPCGNEKRAYGFWSLPSEILGTPTSAYQIPRRAQCASGLVRWPAVEKYGGLHPHAMRHWSVTTLLESGEFSLAEVNWNHGHGLDLSQPLSPSRHEPAFLATRRRAFKCLASHSRLADIT